MGPGESSGSPPKPTRYKIVDEPDLVDSQPPPPPSSSRSGGRTAKPIRSNSYIYPAEKSAPVPPPPSSSSSKPLYNEIPKYVREISPDSAHAPHVVYSKRDGPRQYHEDYRHHPAMGSRRQSTYAWFSTYYIIDLHFLVCFFFLLVSSFDLWLQMEAHWDLTDWLIDLVSFLLLLSSLLLWLWLWMSMSMSMSIPDYNNDSIYLSIFLYFIHPCLFASIVYYCYYQRRWGSPLGVLSYVYFYRYCHLTQHDWNGFISLTRYDGIAFWLNHFIHSEWINPLSWLIEWMILFSSGKEKRWYGCWLRCC